EVNSLEQRARFQRLWIQRQQTSIWLVLHHVARKLRHRILVRRLAEVDRSVGADIQVIQTTKLDAIGFRRQHFDLAGWTDRKQALDRIGNDQVSGAIENHSQRTPLRVGKETWLRSVRLKLHDAAVFDTGIDATLGVDRDVFGFVTVADGK